MQTRLNSQVSPTTGLQYRPHAGPDQIFAAGLMGSETLLIFSEPSMLRDALSDSLHAFGYNVVKAVDSFDVLGCIRANPNIQMVLLDWSEPDPSHLHLALCIRGQHPEVKIVIASETIWDSYYLVDHAEYITFLLKPFTAYELARIVRRMLD